MKVTGFLSPEIEEIKEKKPPSDLR